MRASVTWQSTTNTYLIELDDDKERDMFVIDDLQKIDIDEFLDNVLSGNQIIKNNENKRILLNYSLL
jgi:hypothetical protein